MVSEGCLELSLGKPPFDNDEYIFPVSKETVYNLYEWLGSVIGCDKVCSETKPSFIKTLDKVAEVHKETLSKLSQPDPLEGRTTLNLKKLEVSKVNGVGLDLKVEDMSAKLTNPVTINIQK